MGSKEENLQEQVTTLKNQLDRKVNEMHSMQQIGKTLSSVLDRDRLLILIMDEVTRLMNAERGTLYIVDEEQGELWSKIAQKAEIKEIRLKIGVGIAGHVAKTGEVINIHDAYKDKRFDPTTDKKTGYHTRSILCMAIREPVKTEKQQGKIIAVLQILNKKDGIFTADDEDLLMSLGSQIAISLVNSRLYGVLDNKAKELNLLFNLEKELSRAFDVDDMLQKVVNMIPGALNVEHCLICLLDKDNEKFTSRFADHINKEALMSVPFVVHKGIIGQVMKKKSGYVSNDAGRDKH
ncbi:MAG: GAF domain-containing protein, partial [Calditrichales bacterium]